MHSTNPSADYFDQVAAQWDTIRSGYFNEDLREAAVARAYLHPDMVVADMGCGTGFMTSGLAPRVKHVIALDGSQAMLDVAREKLASFSNIDYRLADSLNIPVEDETVEAVFANMYLHHCPDPLTAIQEMVRILTPGGRLVLTDMESHPHTWFKEEMADVWLGFSRDQIISWFAQADLVNKIIRFSGICCQANSNGNEAPEQAKEMVKVPVFLAVGTKRVRMIENVKAAYSMAIGCDCNSQSNQESTCCCASKMNSDRAFELGYSNDELSSIPQEAQEVIFGCGNPSAFANLISGETVLDIGSGGGLDSFLAAGKVGADGYVIGVDATPAMIARAQKTAERNGIQNVEFRLGQAESLPVEDNSVDAVISNCVINLVEDKGKAFSEIFRVLKPGGRLEINDMVTDISFNATARLDEGAWANCISGALPEKEFLDLLAESGFSQIEIHRSTVQSEWEGTRLFSMIVSARKVRCGCG